MINYDPLTGVITRDGKVEQVKDSHGYLIIKVDGKYIPQTHLAWKLMTGEYPAVEVDHENRVVDDNRWKNLRLATKSQNAQNRVVHKNNRLGIRGVRLRPDGLYEPRLMINGKALYLGVYSILEDAIDARKMAEIKEFTHAG